MNFDVLIEKTFCVVDDQARNLNVLWHVYNIIILHRCLFSLSLSLSIKYTRKIIQACNINIFPLVIMDKGETTCQ